MQFEKGYLYHIYDQGNNRRTIFFNRKNYMFFLRKIKTYITPYADILSWCLMPNHFHLMVLVNEITVGVASNSTVGVASSSTVGVAPSSTVGVAQSHTDSNRTTSHTDSKKQRTINDSIGIMLRSYSQAINKQNNTTGKLIKEKTKAECINCPNGITPSFITKNGITTINIQTSDKQYPQICFDYIHNNPTKAGIVKLNTDWEFSSALDYSNIRNGKLINKNIAEQYIVY